MRVFLAAWLIAAAFAAGPAHAHGNHATNLDRASAERPADLWEWLFGRLDAAATVRIDTRGGDRYIDSDGLPDHATGPFPNRHNPNRIQRRRHTYRVPLAPARGGRDTPIGHNAFGVAINGVPFDPATAEFWHRDRRWNYEAIGGPRDLGLDASNAHVQPNGAYHYHGIPHGILDQGHPRRAPMQIGWAADGFPIYAPWGHRDPGDATGAMVELHSSYRLRSGTRDGGPGRRYDGEFASDFEYVAGHGDLDRCNGRDGVTPEYPDGTYHYVITAEFPFIPRCWRGEPDDSFLKRGPGGGSGPGGGDGGLPGGTERSRGGGFREPPPEAIEACAHRDVGSRCTVPTPRGALDGECRDVPEGTRACVPAGRRPPR